MPDKNIEIIEKFYTAFSKRDAATMNNCYTNDIIFYDPVFGMLEGDKARCMWEMLCKNGKDLKISYGNITALNEEYYTCDWEADYTFSKTGKKVLNKIKANMRIKDGIIMEHSDAFSVHRWSKQAFGFTGWLLGGLSFFQKKIHNGALRSLLDFMKNKYAL